MTHEISDDGRSQETQLFWMWYNIVKMLYSCDILGYYAACSGNCVPTFRANYRSHLKGSTSTDNISVPKRRYETTTIRYVTC